MFNFKVGWGYSDSSLDTTRDHVTQARELPIRAVRNEDCFLEFPTIARISSRRTFCGGWPGFKANVCIGDSGELFCLHSLKILLGRVEMHKNLNLNFKNFKHA